ncbi:MAG TPA: NAD-dependent epimerase/dehydratase family protein [Vicinamibacterales bacterium]|nr:NAD-dependent epimerase/dehydratase family protein [Vicinamibacterales bacterium]
MRVLITGASGLVGGALRRRLGTDPRWRVRASSRTPPVQTAGVDWMTGPDLGPDADWRPLLAGVDVVVHLAARVHLTAFAGAASDELYQRINVLGTRRLAEQAGTAGVRRFVFLSSVKVHGESGHFNEGSAMAPVDPYGASKREGEDALREIAIRTGLESVIVRPPLVYGPGVKANFHSLLTAVRRGTLLPLASIANRRSLVGVDNLADLIAVSMEHPAAAAETFLVSDGEDLSTPELVRRLATAAGRQARLLPLPVWALRAVAAPLGQSPAVDRLTGSLTVDISKARGLLGWAPPVAVDEGLRRVACEP